MLVDNLITCSQKCRDPPHGTILLWNRYVEKHDLNEGDLDEGDSVDEDDLEGDDLGGSNSR